MTDSPRLLVTLLVFLAFGVGWWAGSVPEGDPSAPELRKIEQTCEDNISSAYRLGYDQGQTDAVLGVYLPDYRTGAFRIRVLHDTTDHTHE